MDIEINLSISIGIAFKETKSMEKANMALVHAAKTKSPFALYSKSMKIEEEYEYDIKWSKIIKDAIDNDLVFPFFQPIVDINGHKKFECLMRILKDGEYITPYYFLEIAKKAGFYPKLTTIMIEKSLKYFKDRPESFSINLGFEDISNTKLVDFLIHRIEHYKISDRLIIELVETENISDFEIMQRFINQMKAINVHIAIDDFGSGYSNFSYLLQLKPDFIKIDGSIIKNIDRDKNSQVITQTIVSFSKNLGIKTVAEFIHSKEVYDKTKDLGVDLFQGFYLGKPDKDI